MGCYVNPPDCTKEEFLLEHGELTERPCEITDTHLPVVWVFNGRFSAVGVAYSDDEVEAFNSPSDSRPKRWYKVSREELRKVSDLEIWERRYAINTAFNQGD